MSKKLKIKLKRGKAKIKLKSSDGTPLLPEAQLQALLGASLQHAAATASDSSPEALEFADHSGQNKRIEGTPTATTSTSSGSPMRQ